MLKRLFNRIKRKLSFSSGFTLSETMVTVAIIIMLAAMGVTGMLSIRRRVMITELDETAKQIYAAAQNNLVRLTNSGLSSELAGSAMTGRPVDIDAALDWSEVSNGYRYTSNGESAALLLLPFGSVEDSVRLGGFYVIEYDLKASAVYSVFYSNSDFNYPNISSAGNDSFRVNRRTRVTEMVGYYGGSGVDRDSFTRCDAPIISVENGDELKLTVSGSKAGYSLRVTLADSDTEITVPSSALTLNANGDYTLLLDSLESAERFSERFSALTPGDDITATAYFESSGSLSSYTRTEVNSLFASRSEGEASISCARHLQNLDSDWSGVDPSVTSAVQLAAIDWPTDRELKSIENTALTYYDGSGLEIKDLRGHNGLFKSFTGSELKNIRLANPKINNNTAAASAVGVLAGEVRDCTVRGCRVYAYAYSGGRVNYAAYNDFGLSAIVHAGGLIGSAVNCTVDMCFSALPYIQSFGGNTGGLIGVASGCTVTRSYASCGDMTGTGPAHALGMLICSAPASTVDNCYAVGNSSTAGTQLPFAQNASVKNSYCAFSYLDGSTRNLANDYRAYSANYTLLNYIDAQPLTVFSFGSYWSTTIAALTRPYSRMLDGRAYPYKTVSGLPHYGSWPLPGDLALRVSVILEDGTSGVNAGRVVLTCEGETIYNNNWANVPDVVYVKPNANISISAAANAGYEFVNTRINTEDLNEADADFEVLSDTRITVTFKQTVFTLTGGAVDNSTDTYIAAAGSVAVRPGGTGDVLTGSIVTVEPSSVTSQYYVADVSYTTVDGTVPVYRDENGEFTFAMPAADATVNVKYTDKGADYTVNCYLMDTTGAYPAGSPTYTKSYTYGWGEVIADSLIDYFVNQSHLAVPGCITLADKQITESYEANAPIEITALPFATPSDSGKSGSYAYTIDLYLARAQFDLTLKAGNSITSVTAAGQPAAAELTLANCYYDAEITIDAQTENSLPFTSWSSNSLNFAGTAEQTHTLRMPAHDLELTASAGDENLFVSMSVYKDGDAWANHGQTITLVDISDETQHYTLSNLTAPEQSHLSQGEVKRGRYYIEAASARYTVPNGSGGNPDYVLDLSSAAAELAIDFYTVSYYPNTDSYTGTVPATSVCLYNQEYTVRGNPGMLAAAGKQFAGWYDAYAQLLGREHSYSEGTAIRITRPTQLNANWQTGLSVQYDGNGAVTGTLPAAVSSYSAGDNVPVIFPTDLVRPGYAFAGWSRENNATAPEFTDGGTESFSMPAGNVTLYAVWNIAKYDVRFFDDTGAELTGSDYVKTDLDYGSTLTLPDYAPAGGASFLGWAESLSGGVKYKPGTDVTVNNDMALYAVTAAETCEITFCSADGSEYGRLTVGKNVGTYLPLKVGAADTVSGWSTVAHGGGTVYPRGNSGYTANPVTPSGDLTLYGIDDKVYNQSSNKWYSSLKDAVTAADTAAGNTIIVYNDTTESGIIAIDKALTILSVGSNTVSWSPSANVPNSAGNTHGCIDISNCAVSFGSAAGGGSLTFDANRRSRVVYLRSGAALSMYDGVTLKNGKIGTNNAAVSDEYFQFGGGVLADNGAVFNMYGGTIAFCEAVSGGGAYLIPGSQMSMGNMVTAADTAYSGSRIYYYYDAIGACYMAASNADSTNYTGYFICVGTPAICDNLSTHASPADNDASKYAGGGGVYLRASGQDALKLYSGAITRNMAVCYGGGILADSSAGGQSLHIYEAEISHNSAHKGGGVFQGQGAVYDHSGIIIHNCAYDDGGALYIRNMTTARISGGSMLNNTAGGQGGGIHCEDSGVLELLGGSINDNSDRVSGIDIYLNGSCTINVPAGNGGLRMVAAASAVNSRTAINCANTALGRGIVTYGDGGDYKQTDADFFAFAGAGDFAVLADDAGKSLLLGSAPSPGHRSLGAPQEAAGRSQPSEGGASGSDAAQSLNEHTVTFCYNDGATPDRAELLAHGSSFSVSDYSLARTGYTLAGWNTAQDGSGTAYAPDSVITVEDAIKLYAQWTPDN